MAGLALATIWIAGVRLIHPANRTVGIPPADLPVREVIFSSDTGLPIHGWFVSGQAGRGAVLLLHGVRANRLSMLARARFLHRAGYPVLLIDFQASGESPGQSITFGYREARDAAAAVRTLRRLAPGEPIGIIGTSMGGAATLLAGQAIRADAVVLEQVYPNVEQALRNRLALHAGNIGSWLTLPFLAVLRLQLDVSPDRLRPIDRIHSLSTPKLLIVGACDRHTTLEESLSMYRQAAAPKALWIVPGATHVDLHRWAGPAYEEQVLAFLGTWLRKEPRMGGPTKALNLLSEEEAPHAASAADGCE